MHICPIDYPWDHTFVLEPALQGTAMLNEVWEGAVFRPVIQPNVSLKERAICLIKGLGYVAVGALLCLPFLNTIIWLAWQTFGKPEPLFDPYSPEGDPVPLSPPPPLPQAVAPSRAQAYKSEALSYQEGAMRVDWKVDHYRDQTVSQQTGPGYVDASFYSPDGLITRYEYKKGEQEFKARRIDAKQIEASINDQKKVLVLEEDLPWIQQYTLGFRPFLRSKETEMPFYGILFQPSSFFKWVARPPLLIKMVAKKEGKEKIIIKHATWGIQLAELWFDPATRVLEKYVTKENSGTLSAKKIQNHLLPELGHLRSPDQPRNARHL